MLIISPNHCVRNFRSRLHWLLASVKQGGFFSWGRGVIFQGRRAVVCSFLQSTKQTGTVLFGDVIWY